MGNQSGRSKRSSVLDRGLETASSHGAGGDGTAGANGNGSTSAQSRRGSTSIVSPNPWDTSMRFSTMTYPPGTQLPPDYDWSKRSASNGKQKKKPFHKWERAMLKTTFADLASRSASGKSIDRETFLKFFSQVPGMLGERLFFVFNKSGSGGLDYEEFVSGLAAYARGSMEQKVGFLFRMCNLSNSGRVSRAELETMCNNFVFAQETLQRQQAVNSLQVGDGSPNINPSAALGGSLQQNHAGASSSATPHLTAHIQEMKTRAHSPSFPYASEEANRSAAAAQSEAGRSTAAAAASSGDAQDGAALQILIQPASTTHASQSSPKHAPNGGLSPLPEAGASRNSFLGVSSHPASHSHHAALRHSPSSEDVLSPLGGHPIEPDWMHASRVKEMVDDAFRISGGGGSQASSAGAAAEKNGAALAASVPASPIGASNIGHPHPSLHVSTASISSASPFPLTASPAAGPASVGPNYTTPASAASAAAPAPSSTPQSSSTLASSEGLSMYHFGAWLQDHPEIFEVLDAAFVGGSKGADGVGAGGGGGAWSDDQQQREKKERDNEAQAVANTAAQQQNGAHLGLPSASSSNPSHRGSFVGVGGGLSHRNSSTGSDGDSGGGNGGALLQPTSTLATGTANHRFSSFSIPALLTPQHPTPAGAVAASGGGGAGGNAMNGGVNSLGKGNGASLHHSPFHSGGTPMGSPEILNSNSGGNGNLGANDVIPPPSLSLAASSAASMKSEEKATWKNGPRLSISALSSAQSLLHAPTSTRAASSSISTGNGGMIGGTGSSRFPSHTHAAAPTGDFGSGAQGRFAHYSSSPAVGTGSLSAASHPYHLHCDACGFDLVMKHCLACGGLITTIPANSAQPMLPHSSAAGTSSTASSTTPQPPHTSHAHSLFPISGSASASPVDQMVHGCSSCLTPVLPQLQSSARFCCACGCDLLAWSTSHNRLQSSSHSLAGPLPRLEPPLVKTMEWHRQQRERGQTTSIEGYLKKEGRRLKNIMSRWYVIRDNFMYTYARPHEFKPAHVLFLEGCFVEPVNHEDRNAKLKWGIEIILSEEPRKSRFVYASSAESRQQWLECIRAHANVHDIEDFYVIGAELGVGRFSSVRACVSKASGREYAVKIIDKSEVNEKEREALRTEVAVLKLVHHPSIIRLRNVFETRKQMFLVLTFVRGGDLFDRLCKRKRFSEAATQAIMVQLLQVVQYLHVRGIVHRDLKPENILLVGEGEEEREQIMLADFGLGAFALPDQAMKLPCGTLTFTAPDVLNGKGYGMEVDLWSCGVICFLLLRGSLPFDGKTTEEIREKITHGRYQLDGHQVWNEVSQECKDLIRGLLTVDPSQRLTCQQALDHPFFKLKFPSSSAAAHAPAATTSTVTTPAAGPTVSPPVAAASPEANAASTAPHTPAQLDLDAMSNSLTLSSSQQPTGSGGGGSIDVSPFTDTAKTSTFPSASSTPSLPLSHATSPLPRRDAATAAPGVGMAEDYSSSLSSNLTGVTYAYGTAGSSTGNSQPNSLTSSLVLQSQPPPPPPAESEYVLPAPTPASTARASLSAMSPIPIEDRPFQEPTGRRGSVASSPHLLHQVEFTSPESSQGDSLASPPAHYISPQPHLVSMQASPGSEDSEILNRRDSD